MKTIPEPTADPDPPLTELEAQEVRQLLPIFKDLLEGFELKLRLEVFEPKKWASTQKGRLATNRLAIP